MLLYIEAVYRWKPRVQILVKIKFQSKAFQLAVSRFLNSTRHSGSHGQNPQYKLHDLSELSSVYAKIVASVLDQQCGNFYCYRFVLYVSEKLKTR